MPTNEDLAKLRREYSLRGLLETELSPDPLEQFHRWLHEAVEHALIEPNAMTLATVDATGQPWCRTVLLKTCDKRGFVFFTNYDSHKGEQLAHESRCALTFWWGALERQVNIAGIAEKVPRSETEAYYAVRPLTARLGGLASNQSRVIPDRAALERSMEEARAKYGDNPPAPPHWGGYVIRPSVIEFWQGRSSRLHDRLRYTRTADAWRVDRLSP
jgi:pyridoxamine 5'-phosphate oxidase